MKSFLRLLPILLLPNIASGDGSFLDDTGATITWSTDKPTIVCGAMDAIALSHFGMESSQIVGVFGEQSSSGSNYGGVYHDGNVNDLVDHSLLDHDPSLFPADPNEEERAFLESISLDLSPSCSGSNYYCDEINTEILDKNSWPDLIIVGSFYSYLLTDEVREAAFSNGVPIMVLSDSYNPGNQNGIPPRSMIDMIVRMETLAETLGVEGVKEVSDGDKQRFCTAAKDFRSQTQKAQDKGVRAMAGYLPYGKTADGKAGAFINSPERDTVLAMFEELGMPILHNDAEAAYEYFTINDADGQPVGTLPYETLMSGGVSGPSVPYYVDFWLYDDRVTLDFVSEEFKDKWPHVAVVNKQYAYFPSNARIYSYKHAAEILYEVGSEFGKAAKLNEEETTCTPPPEGGFSGDVHRLTGLKAGGYACYQPIDYDFCQTEFNVCLSATANVNILGKGDISLEELRIGDQIQVGDGEYEPVYSFGHRDTQISANYLSLTGKGMEKPLEISSDHLIFVDNVSIPASLIRVGDKVDLVNGEKSEILKVKKIRRHDGAFAPFTPSGKFIANNVIVSSYVSLQKDSAVLKVFDTPTPFTMQWLAHTFKAPHRMICNLDFSICREESYVNGVSVWVAKSLQISKWVLNQSAWIQIPFTAAFIALISLFWVLEILCNNCFLAITILLGYKMLKWCDFTKK